MNSTVRLREGTSRKPLDELTSPTASRLTIKVGHRGRLDDVNFDDTNLLNDVPLEQFSCTGVQMGYTKDSDRDSYCEFTRKPTRHDDGGGASSNGGLRLPTTRVTVYPQRDISESWKGRPDFSLPRLDVLKVQLERRVPEDSCSRSLSVPNSDWLPLAWDLGRTRSADSYFRHGQQQGQKGPHFQTRVQMERAFNAYVTTKSQPRVAPVRPNTRISTAPYSSSQTSASSNRKHAADKAATLTWYSAPNRQRVVRQSPPWRSLMNRRPRGVRADNSNLCPYHCRCCFNEVNDIESSTVYKMNLGAL